jgi:dehydrogenase/reductase SDR family protein 12
VRLRDLALRTADAICDPSIVSSFDRTGFWRHSQQFDPTDLDVDITGRRCLVTGANSGIGFATASALAARGARTVLLCRSPERAADARQRILTAHPKAEVHIELVDLSEQASIHALAARLAPGKIDVLVHNAGVLPARHHLTADGIEQTLATNLVGPHLLTRLLLPRLRDSDDGRLIFVSSGGMYAEKLSVQRLVMPPERFDGVVAYARTKRALVVLAEQLSAELAGTDITVSSMHPGWADTPAVRTSIPTFHRITRAILRTPEQGADTVIWLAAAQAPRGQSGRFWFDRKPRRAHFVPWTRESDGERTALMRQLEAWVR